MAKLDAIGVNKTDTLAADLAVAGTSATLTSGNFGTQTGVQYLVLDYDVPAKIEVVRCTITGTSITSMTRGLDRTTDVAHSSGAKVLFTLTPGMWSAVKGAAFDGWVNPYETWTYASATAFTISGDVTDIYSPGDKVRLKQGGSYKYFVVTGTSYSNPDTTININGGNDYTFTNATVTDNYYSKSATPIGFPSSFAWTPQLFKNDGSTSLTGTTSIARFWTNGRTCHILISLTGVGDPSGSKIYSSVPINSVDRGANARIVGAGHTNSNGTIDAGYAGFASSVFNKIYIERATVDAWATASNAANMTITYEF